MERLALILAIALPLSAVKADEIEWNCIEPPLPACAETHQYPLNRRLQPECDLEMVQHAGKLVVYHHCLVLAEETARKNYERMWEFLRCTLAELAFCPLHGALLRGPRQAD